MSELTPRQTEVLAFIRECIQDSGMPPTRAEIAGKLGFRSANAAEEHLRALQRKGAIKLIPGASRGIQLIGESPDSFGLAQAGMEGMEGQFDGLPVIGRVAAGNPILAEEHIEEHVRIDPAMFDPVPHYLLRVQGMSMKNVGILDGDLVAVHRTPEVRNRQIIVARLEDEVTVKRYRQRGKTVWLMPENEDFSPIEVDLEKQHLMIEGVVVGLLRNGIPFKH
jgi:repressor LexA